jgi:hypothetical protein
VRARFLLLMETLRQLCVRRGLIEQTAKSFTAQDLFEQFVETSNCRIIANLGVYCEASLICILASAILDCLRAR